MEYFGIFNVEKRLENMKKIVFVIDLIKGGGGAQKVLKIALQSLRDAGHDVSLIVFKKSQNELEFNGFKLHYVLENENEKLMPNAFKIIENIRNIAREADILCSFMDFITTYFTALAHTTRINEKQKLFCFVRNSLPYLSQNFVQQELNLKLNLLALKSANKVIANSLFCQNELINFGITNVILLRNPAIINECKNEVKYENYAIAIGRLVNDKNYETMIKAFKRANLKNLKLIILGEGDKLSELKQLANGANIEFLGYKNNATEYIKNAKFFIHASYFEGSPNSVLESYMLAKPAILSDIEPNREIYENNAIYCKCDDKEAFAKSIIKMNENPMNFTPNLEKFSIHTFKENLLRIFE